MGGIAMKTLSYWILSIFLILLVMGCKSSGGRDPQPNDLRDRPNFRSRSTPPTELESTVDLTKLREFVMSDSSFPIIKTTTNYAKFDHYVSEFEEDRCRFFGIGFLKYDCWKKDTDRERRYEYKVKLSRIRVTLSGSLDGVNVSSDNREAYRNRIKNYLRNVVLGGPGQKTITRVPLSELDPGGSLTYLSTFMGGSGASGNAVRVLHGSGATVYLFSFGLPLEANPIAEEVVEEEETEDEQIERSYRVKYLQYQVY